MLRARELSARSRISLDEAPATSAITLVTGIEGLRITPREYDVLRELANGRSNQEIANHLFISNRTVAVHVSNLLAKLGVARRGQAAAAAHRLGLIDK